MPLEKKSIRMRLMTIIEAAVLALLMDAFYKFLHYDLLVGICACACFGVAFSAVASMRAISKRMGDRPGTYRTMLDLVAVAVIGLCLFVYFVQVWGGFISYGVTGDIVLLFGSIACAIIVFRRLRACGKQD